MTEQTLEDLKISTNKDPLELLKKAIVTYDNGLATDSARTIVEEKRDPLEAWAAMTMAIRLVGEAFDKGELWLPDLVGAAEAMSAAKSIIEEEIEKRGAKAETPGTVVLGTVYGDIHSIGKTMVGTLLVAEGFAVHDLDVNVTAEAFVEAVQKHDADILAMSALLTSTAPEQRKVIEALKREGLRDRVKVMVGGGAITEEFAEAIGADGYDPTAPGAAKLAREFVGQ